MFATIRRTVGKLAGVSSPGGPEAATRSAAGHAPATARPSRDLELWHRLVFILFLLIWLVNCVLLLLRVQLPAEGQWVESLLPVLAVATTLLALGRRLPLQNVLTAAFLIGGIGTLITAVAAASGIPFGPIVYGTALGEKLFGLVPWPIPFLWVVLVINGRGVARLIMRPWRKTNYYGYWVIAFTCLLAVVFELGFEPFAVQVRGYWIWLAGRSALAWHTAPWVNFLGWFVSVLGVVTFTLPWLINKQPVKQPTDYHPLAIWLLLNLWVAMGNGVAGMGSAVIVPALGHLIAAVYAIRGARW
jgi:uncharacterized membrane protein